MRAINAVLLGLILFLVGYCVCFWFGLMPKYYPMLHEIHVANLKGQIAVKFVGSAVVGLALGVVGFGVGLALPRKSTLLIHVATWCIMIAATAYLVGREAGEYILGW